MLLSSFIIFLHIVVFSRKSVSNLQEICCMYASDHEHKFNNFLTEINRLIFYQADVVDTNEFLEVPFRKFISKIFIFMMML